MSSSPSKIVVSEQQKPRKELSKSNKNNSNNNNNNNNHFPALPEKNEEDKNPLLDEQINFLVSLPKPVQQNFFSNQHISPETRAQIWSDQAELGEKLVNKYSWATPDKRALNIIKYYASQCDGIVEIGCGGNAYWAKLMTDLGINVLAFDVQLHKGGKISNGKFDANNDHGEDSMNNCNGDSVKRKRKHCSIQNDGDIQIESKSFPNGLTIYKGGPEMLSNQYKFQSIQNMVLFLCYPDEDVFFEEETNQDDQSDYENEDNSQYATSMGAACLEHFKGDTIIHVGELYGDTLSMDHSPWGRSSGAQFQQRLFSEYHCILRAKLTNWLHVRDTISVWKRTECCSIVFQAEEDEQENEESDYKYIPANEILQIDIAAPCAQHLL